MERLSRGASTPGRSAFRSLAAVGAAVAWTAAVAVAAVLAIFFAATVVVISLMGVALLGLAGLALRARRMRTRPGSDIIEARHIGGHHWVAYGWDGR